MGGAVEVLGAQHLDDVGDRVLGQQHPAEHGLFGLDVVGWRSLERRVVDRRLRDAHLNPLPNRPPPRSSGPV